MQVVLSVLFTAALATAAPAVLAQASPTSPPRDTTPRGGEVGLRAAPLDGLRSTVSVWALNLDSELLFTGDAGITEPAAASRRRGVTVASFYRPVPQLSLDADVSFRARRVCGRRSGVSMLNVLNGRAADIQ